MVPSDRLVRTLRARLSARHLLSVCLIAAALLRLAFMVFFRVAPVSDFDWYYGRAVELSRGGGLHFHGHPTAFWPVGYPAFLSLVFRVFGPSVWVAQCANVALSIGILVLAHRLAFKLSNSRLAASATLLILTLFPNQIAYSALVASEPLGCFLMLFGIELLLAPRRGYALLSGLAFGAACLVKPQLLLLPGAILMIQALLQRREYREHRRAGVYAQFALRAGLVYLSLSAVLAPWTLRNYRVFGGFVFVANSGGGNLLIGNNPDATGTYPTPAVDKKLHRQLLPLVPGRDEYAVDKKAHALALAYLRARPIEALLRVPRKVFYLYAKDVDGFSWMQEGAPRTSGRYRLLVFGKGLAQAYYGLVVLLFLGALVSARRHRRWKSIWLSLTVIGYVTVLYSVYFGISRFHFLAIPWIAMQVGSLVAAWLEAPTLEAPPAVRVAAGP
jgi:4-amino-4-deoxy-L-arabinose transferase-like glycosyltransferase